MHKVGFSQFKIRLIHIIHNSHLPFQDIIQFTTFSQVYSYSLCNYYKLHYFEATYIKTRQKFAQSIRGENYSSLPGKVHTLQSYTRAFDLVNLVPWCFYLAIQVGVKSFQTLWCDWWGSTFFMDVSARVITKCFESKNIKKKKIRKTTRQQQIINKLERLYKWYIEKRN